MQQIQACITIARPVWVLGLKLRVPVARVDGPDDVVDLVREYTSRSVFRVVAMCNMVMWSRRSG
jgi:hypothetical protein